MTARPLESIAGFVHYLREHGLVIGLAEQQAMVRGALLCSADDTVRLRTVWRSLVCHGVGQWRRFPELFDAYWFPHRIAGEVRVSGMTRPRRDIRQMVEELHQAISQEAMAAGSDAANVGLAAAQAPGDDASFKQAQGGASRSDPLASRDQNQQWLMQELIALERIVERLARLLRDRLLRRQRHDLHGKRLDIRRTLRQSLRTGGVPFDPVWRTPCREQPRLFVVVDVSRSMQAYAQLFLRIARAFVTVLHARVFIFHTRLAEVTPLLQRDSGRIQEKINAVTAGFGGGTRIATSLADLVTVHARTQLGRGARVLIASDGFDADAPGELALQLARIRARGARIVWVHPTRTRPGSIAMEDCDRFIDAFAPVHNLESLAHLDRLLTSGG